MMNRRIVGTALYVVIGTLASFASAEEKRQLDSHVHGAAKMDLVVEGQAINIRFESPAVNIIGFERAPETPEQQSLVEEAKKALGMVSSIIELPDQAGCVLTHNSVEWIVEHAEYSDAQNNQEEEEEHKENEEHTKQGEHEEDEEDEEHEEHEEQVSHSEFQAEYVVKCRNIAVVESVVVKLFDHYQGLEEIDMQAILPSGQTAMEMTPSSNTISLR